MSADWDQDRARLIVEGHRQLPGALLPMLHALQEEFGHIADDAVPMLAEVLNLSLADIHGVVSFYHDFRRTRPGRHIIRVCVAEACQARGSQALVDALTQRLGLLPGDTDAQGRFTLEAVYCLGNCALGPSAMVDGHLHGRLSAGALDSLLAGEGVS